MALPKIQKKLEWVSSRIKQLERAYLPPHESAKLPGWKWSTIIPEEGKRVPVYRSSPPGQLYEQLGQMVNIKKVDLSQVDAADLGSGLCASSVVLAEFCRSVTGFELNKDFARDGRLVCREFGYKNVKVKEKDFVEEDLSGFRLWYLYAPFFEDFQTTAAEMFGRAASGTLIISRTIIDPILIKPDKVRFFYPEDPAEFNKGDFHVFIRA